MRLNIASFLVMYAAAVHAVQGKAQKTFAVLRFNNAPGSFSSAGRMDPIVFPGSDSSHTHGIMGGSNFDLTVTGDQLLHSNCTNAKIKNDKSNYWVSTLWFRKGGKFKKVPLYYMNVYYFFEATDDEIKAFPPGFKMVSGNASTRLPPATGSIQLDPSKGTIQPVQWTCPTKNAVDHYPAGSDGSHAGIQDPSNRQSGAGFPVVNCDADNSPLRQDIHFPSCYDPSVGTEDYANNMVFPTPISPGSDKVNCPKGYIHVPHLFYEVYYDTAQFDSQWIRDGHHQPFVLSNGDNTGFSSHGDFISGWDEQTLQAIIDTCDVGDRSNGPDGNDMEDCPNIPGGLNKDDKCPIKAQYPDPGDEWVDALPGNNPISGWMPDQ
ncbi:hypothetical protein PFICI_10169 [Pestalotiopsis fici W106-1]|uniref:DUF1996 domain-containing protein n=1 Tax=Pestalotiopsis fici (strain W106-1 / CGMCC3.15140) TaxID=1229662 RepID=W3WY86_PESFW|nr:uncharacterized protein PFICI_10169 [Pestalotiopsis fici W106-1]ETS78107.1 hypothetical protein PFICI_10169 [Pestalotiopsis fici W106-1]